MDRVVSFRDWWIGSAVYPLLSINSHARVTLRPMVTDMPPHNVSLLLDHLH